MVDLPGFNVKLARHQLVCVLNAILTFLIPLNNLSSHYFLRVSTWATLQLSQLYLSPIRLTKSHEMKLVTKNNDYGKLLVISLDIVI